LRITTNSNNDIFVGGNYTTGGKQDVLVLKYNSTGTLIFERRYNGTTNNTDKFMDFTIDNDKIYVSAKTYSTATVDENITIQYITKSVDKYINLFKLRRPSSCGKHVVNYDFLSSDIID